ncbi:MAG: TIM44-like domain-containing protein [Kofleriaceae bacterium]
MTLEMFRPGGGESFSGGGGHGGGGGGGGGGFVLELLYWLLQLFIYHPLIALVLVAIVAFLLWRQAREQRANADWDSGPPTALHKNIPLTAVANLDPEFSQVVFEDFVYRLFSEAQRVRASVEGLATIVPYVSEAARDALAQRPPVGMAVEQVIVGAQRVIDVALPAKRERGNNIEVTVEFEANVLTKDHTYYSVETWVFVRDVALRSKPPEISKVWRCPNCGAPWQASNTGSEVCQNCGQAVANGRFDWYVDRIELKSVDERGPTLTQDVKERGTDLPTYKDPERDDEWEALVAADPDVTEPTVEHRLQMIYDLLNKAWSANDLKTVRGFVSDGLFDYLQYWVDAYKREGFRNQLTDMRITNVEYAKVVRDKYYDAITIRFWAIGKDFVVKSATGQLVRGSKTRERAYSEYWTLMRAAGKKGVPKAEPVCGNCGAPLLVNASGECEHCGAHVTAGEFDWVLSKIEQDDTYRG